MGLRDRWRRIERAGRGVMVEIPQRDGTVRRFEPDELPKAYISAYDLALGREVEEHPMLDAMRNSSDPKWREMWGDLLTPEPGNLGPVEDLSE